MSRQRIALPLFLILLVLTFSSCQGDTDESPGVSKETSEYSDLTEKEHIILNYNQCFIDKDMAQYLELLHPDYASYGPDLKAIDHDFDIDGMKYIFSIDDYKMKFEDGSWEIISDFLGQPCKNCWATTRAYSLSGTIEGSFISTTGNGKFIIKPTSDASPELYKLLAFIDVGRD